MLRRVLPISLILFCVGSIRGADSFAGTWETTFGRLVLTQEGDEVKGKYQMGPDATCTLQGKVEKDKLTFKYKEPDATGEGWFQLAQGGQSFDGQWRQTGDKEWRPWNGKRLVGAVDKGFAGVWDTSFGKMRLVVQGDRIHGTYAYAAGSSMDGTIKDKKLVFKYKEPAAEGEGEFELSPDESSFTGRWREKGKEKWEPWTGERVRPVAGRVWLIIVEARWERDLTDKEYAFGDMLRAFFARSAQVEVRHRYYTDEASLRKWCGEVAFLAEPAVLVLATHACPEGVTVDNKVIGAAAFADSLRYATNLRLLHFSACQALKEHLATDIQEKLGGVVSFPISGYTKVVDWAASAILEFTYLEMVLLRNMSPAAAAEQVPKMLTFAGEKSAPDSVFKGAGFKIVMPRGEK
jgi:hypothetical protein